MSEHDRFRSEVRKRAEGLSYPIRDAQALVRQLGGADAVVTWRGTRHRVGQAVRILPSYYFPVESEDDLLNKAVNLEVLRPGTPLAMAEPGRQLDKATIKGQPPGRLADFPLPTKGTVSVGGPGLAVGMRRHDGP